GTAAGVGGAGGGSTAGPASGAPATGAALAAGPDRCSGEAGAGRASRVASADVGGSGRPGVATPAGAGARCAPGASPRGAPPLPPARSSTRSTRRAVTPSAGGAASHAVPSAPPATSPPAWRSRETAGASPSPRLTGADPSVTGAGAPSPGGAAAPHGDAGPASVERGAEADHHAGAERREAGRLLVVLVEDVLRAEVEDQARQRPPPPDGKPVRGGGVHDRVAGRPRLPGCLEAARQDQDLAGQRDPRPRLPGGGHADLVRRDPPERLVVGEVVGVGVRVRERQREPVDRREARLHLHAPAARAPDVLGLEAGVHRIDEGRLDEVVEVVVEVRRREPRAARPEVLLDPRVPALALLRAQPGIPERGARREGGKEELVEGRRAEALAPARLEARVRLLDQVRERRARGGLVLEDVVAVVA